MRNAKHVIHGVSFVILRHHSRYPVIDDVHSLAGRFHGIASNQLLNGQLCVTLLITQAQQKFEYVGMRLSHDMAYSTVPSLQTVGGTWLVRYSTVVHSTFSARTWAFSLQWRASVHARQFSVCRCKSARSTWRLALRRCKLWHKAHQM